MESRRNSRMSQFRFDEKTSFAMRLIARQRNQKLTAAVSNAIRQAATHLDLGGHSWLDLYDEHEGICLLLCLACPTYQPSPEEEDLRRFALKHREFFYADQKATIPKRTTVEVLWPKIASYQEHWNKTKNESPSATAKLMAAELKAEGLPTPKAAA